MKVNPETFTQDLVATRTYPYVAITTEGEVKATWSYPEAKEIAGEEGWAGRPSNLLDEEGEVEWGGVEYLLPFLSR
jgi:hypothetical protein